MLDMLSYMDMLSSSDDYDHHNLVCQHSHDLIEA